MIAKGTKCSWAGTNDIKINKNTHPYTRMNRTVESAVSAAGNGDQIWIAEGTYTPTSDSNDISATFKLIQDGIAIYGGFVGTETSVDQRQSPLPTTTLSGSIGMIIRFCVLLVVQWCAVD